MYLDVRKNLAAKEPPHQEISSMQSLPSGDRSGIGANTAI